jgi:hypothetical protein
MVRILTASLCTLTGLVSAAEGTPRINACALLSSAQIAHSIGFPTGSGTHEDAGIDSTGSYSSVCVWIVNTGKDKSPDPTAPLNGRDFVILNARQWPVGSGRAREFLESFRSAAAKGEISASPVAKKYGDEALWWGDGLAVRKGDVSFGVSVFLPAIAAKSSGALEEKLAPLILQSLQRREAPLRHESSR